MLLGVVVGRQQEVRARGGEEEKKGGEEMSRRFVRFRERVCRDSYGVCVACIRNLFFKKSIFKGTFIPSKVKTTSLR